MKKILTTLLLSLTVLVLFAADVYENKVFSAGIKTVRLYPSTNEIAMPILNLNSGEKLLFSFDDLTQDSKTYYYTVVQCDFEWKPTQQGNFEYIDGFTQATLNDFSFSANTRQSYVHYKMDFPNDDMNVKQSGNYVLVVYENSPDEPTLTWRFMVAESRVAIDAQIVIPRSSSQMNRFHEVLFNVNHQGLQINNGYQEIKASVLQNQRWDSAITGLAPRMTRFNQMDFDYNGAVIFEAGREFRRFDMRSLRFNGDGIRSIQGNDVYLLIDQPRTNQKYFIETDINGQFYTDVLEFRNRSTEADYAMVHFNIAMPYALDNGKVYVGGMFNNYDADEQAALKWNASTGMYETSYFMKQGFYNYQYYFMPNKSNKKDISLTEGNHFDAENRYDIFIYYRPFGERYDRLIGMKSLNSMANGQR